MSRFHGPAHRGAMAALQALRREEADARNAKTKRGRRRKARREAQLATGDDR